MPNIPFSVSLSDQKMTGKYSFFTTTFLDKSELDFCNFNANLVLPNYLRSISLLGFVYQHPKRLKEKLSLFVFTNKAEESVPI